MCPPTWKTVVQLIQTLVGLPYSYHMEHMTPRHSNQGSFPALNTLESFCCLLQICAPHSRDTLAQEETISWHVWGTKPSCSQIPFIRQHLRQTGHLQPFLHYYTFPHLGSYSSKITAVVRWRQWQKSNSFTSKLHMTIVSHKVLYHSDHPRLSQVILDSGGRCVCTMT